ncbi:hypothetical protein BDW02DRAFT_216153 [Decorospora gaudefroyi]|uniref:Uncharacterized protein n=1 Tax=Decorospora gaudefroyi TaxID=184978 RepID=A0A6A5K2A9_9PLEO|nr:hypothetical protein BDW02DRAFT_216153 [Decorospora gaudefroyi]
MPAVSIVPHLDWLKTLPSDCPHHSIDASREIPAARPASRVGRQVPTSTHGLATATSTSVSPASQHPSEEVIGGVIVGSVTALVLIYVLCCVYYPRRSKTGPPKRTSPPEPPPGPRPQMPPQRMPQNPPPIHRRPTRIGLVDGRPAVVRQIPLRDIPRPVVRRPPRERPPVRIENLQREITARILGMG